MKVILQHFNWKIKDNKYNTPGDQHIYIIDPEKGKMMCDVNKPVLDKDFENPPMTYYHMFKEQLDTLREYLEKNDIQYEAICEAWNVTKKGKTKKIKGNKLEITI